LAPHETEHGDGRGAPDVTDAEDVNLLKAPGAVVPAEYSDQVRLAAAGDAAALERLLLRVQKVTWRFSTSVCGHADAEDAMQEGLLKT